MKERSARTKLKVLFVVYDFPSLSTTFILNQITGLLDKGHDVEIFASEKFEAPEYHEDVEKYDVLSKTFFRATASSSTVRYLKSFLYLFKLVFTNPRVIWRIWRLEKSHSKEQTFRTTLADCIAFREPKLYDVILAHMGPNGTRAVRLRQLGLLKGKIVTFFHGSDVSTIVADLGRGLYKQIFKGGELFLPISTFWKNRLIQLGAPTSRTEVFRMGVDCDALHFSPPTFRQGKRVELATVSRLAEIKGIEYAIRAVAQVVRQGFVNLRYRIVGYGPLETKLTELIAELGLDEYVQLIGRKTQQGVRALFNDADIALAPSIRTQEGGIEGIPVALMEAMACGLYVISTNYGSIPELVEHEVSGFLTQPKDVDGIASIIKKLMSRPEEFNHIPRAARLKIEKEFSISSLIADLDRTLQNVCRKGCNEKR